MRKALVSTLALSIMGVSSVALGTTPGQAVISVTAGQKVVAPGGTFDVHVFLSNAQEVGVYELHMKVEGTEGGELALEKITIDKTRKNFLYGTSQIVEAVDMKGKRTAVVTYGPGADAPANDSKYLATFTYRVPEDARGTFTVGINTEKAFVSNIRVEPIAYTTGDPASVTVGSLQREPKKQRSR